MNRILEAIDLLFMLKSILMVSYCLGTHVLDGSSASAAEISACTLLVRCSLAMVSDCAQVLVFGSSTTSCGRYSPSRDSEQSTLMQWDSLIFGLLLG